jgi:DNA-binding NtrC family response regulator
LPPGLSEKSETGWIRIPVGISMEEAEKIVIRDTLSANKGNKTKTSEVLGLGRKTLHRKLQDYRLADDDDE